MMQRDSTVWKVGAGSRSRDRRKYDVPVSGHAHDGPSQACPDGGDRLGLGERLCRTGVVKFAFSVVVVDQQRKAGRAGGLRPFQHLPVTPGVAGGQDRPAAQLGLDVGDLGAALVCDAEQAAGAPDDRLDRRRHGRRRSR